MQTLNLQHSTNISNAVDFVNSNTSWTTGSWSGISADKPALDAHWGAEKVLDYWNTVHTRNSIDGNGIAVLSYVHYGTGVDNAYWFGGSNNHYMVYGDGSLIPPLTALDICAHEFGHGICEFTANLNQGTNGTDEANALNEGLSDIWGACVENFSITGKQTWLLGEDLFTSSYTCIRNMQNPKSTTAFEGQHPDTYHGTYWSSSGEPHYNSTVLSHWFYLVSQGGSGTNDNSNTYNVSGIGITDASRIVYQAETNYLHAGSNYANARTAMIQAAIDIFGAGSCQEIAVTNAWYAVGVGATYLGNGGFSINGDEVVCGTSNNYTIANLPVGATVQWNISPSDIATVNSPNSSQTTITKNDNGIITLTATLSNICGSGTIDVSKNIIVGIPTTFTGLFGNYPQTAVVTTDDGSNDINSDQPTYVTFTSNEYIAPGQPSIQYSSMTLLQSSQNFPAGSYRWQYIKNSNYGQLYLYMPDNSWADFQFTLANACGSNTFELYFQAYQGAYYKLSPNPAKEIVTVQVDEEKLTKSNTLKSNEQDIREINIVDKMGNILQRKTFSKGTRTASINTSFLKPDIYVVRIFNGKTWKSLQLLKQ